MIELFIPQILDSSLNKNNDGNIVASMFVQYAPYKLKNGRNWDKEAR